MVLEIKSKFGSNTGIGEMIYAHTKNTWEKQANKSPEGLFSYHKGYVLYQVTLTLYHIASQKRLSKMFFNGTRLLP